MVRVLRPQIVCANQIGLINMTYIICVNGYMNWLQIDRAIDSYNFQMGEIRKTSCAVPWLLTLVLISVTCLQPSVAVCHCTSI